MSQDIFHWKDVLKIGIKYLTPKKPSTVESHMLWHSECCSTRKVKVRSKFLFCNFCMMKYTAREMKRLKCVKRKKKKKEKTAGKVLGQKENEGTIRWHSKKRIGKKWPEWHQKLAQAAEAGTQINNEYADRMRSGPMQMGKETSEREPTRAAENYLTQPSVKFQEWASARIVSFPLILIPLYRR